MMSIIIIAVIIVIRTRGLFSIPQIDDPPRGGARLKLQTYLYLRQQTRS